jgi:GNAT superfamily N-acetyltransferase
MQNKFKLHQSLITHYTLSKIIKKLLNPINIFELDEIMYQLSDAQLTNFEVDDYAFNIELVYNKNLSNILTSVGRGICKSNQFELIISNEDIDKTNATLSFSFLHHNLKYLIDTIIYGDNSKSIPKSIVKILDNLRFKISKQNKDIQLEEDAQKLIKWAKELNISENILPHSPDKLFALEVLDLSNLNLGYIPKYIRVLKNLKKLYLVNNGLKILPLEIFSLKNLELLWLQDNKLAYLWDEVNNLTKLRELVLYDNDIQKLPTRMNLQMLTFIALHRNRLAKDDIDKFLAILPTNIKSTSYDQKRLLPFYIEPLSYLTLQEATILRDTIFNDIDEDEKKLFDASLSPIANKKVLRLNDIKIVHYWIARDKKSAKIIGITGIYSEIKDEEDDCWLGWFCIDKKYRKKGFGKQLFDFSIELAQNMDKRTLHIYTYNIKKHAKAIEMYKRSGFKEYRVEDTKYKRDLYFKKAIL